MKEEAHWVGHSHISTDENLQGMSLVMSSRKLDNECIAGSSDQWYDRQTNMPN